MPLPQPAHSMLPELTPSTHRALEQAARYPHLRYMGSKYRLLPVLADVFQQLAPVSAVDPFCGSGVVSYLLKSLGISVATSDYLRFPVALTRAACVNQRTLLDADDIERIIEAKNLDDRDFISATYRGRYFTPADLEFLDSAWSHIAALEPAKQDLSIAALILAAARKQPRGVFTVTGLRYDDGRESLHLPLAEQFRRCAAAWNASVFAGAPCTANQRDASAAPTGADLVYLDPPYAPPRDDNDYIKRYWFLEGLADYWQNGSAAVMAETRTKKLPKRATAFGSKATINGALRTIIERFSTSAIVLSYGSNAVPDLDTLLGMLRDVKGAKPEVLRMPHRYHFGTHAAAVRRQAEEYIIVAP